MPREPRIGVARHVVGIHDLPVAALLRHVGLEEPIVRIVAAALHEHANEDASLESSNDAAGEPGEADRDAERLFAASSVLATATAAAGPTSSKSPTASRAASGIGALVAGLTPASMLRDPALTRRLSRSRAGRSPKRALPRGRRAETDDPVGHARARLAKTLEDKSVAPLLQALCRLLDGPQSIATAAIAYCGHRRAVAGDGIGSREMDEARAARGRGAASLVLALGVDLEYSAGDRPRRALDRQLGRLATLAQRAAGSVVPMVPCDPARPECVGVVRECLDRGFLGACVPDRPFTATSSSRRVAWDRDGERRLLEVLGLCVERGAPLLIVLDHPLHGGVGGRGEVTASWWKQRLKPWKERLAHRRFDSLAVGLVRGRTLFGWTTRSSKAPAAAGVDAAKLLRLRAYLDGRAKRLLTPTAMAALRGSVSRRGSAASSGAGRTAARSAASAAAVVVTARAPAPAAPRRPRATATARSAAPAGGASGASTARSGARWDCDCVVLGAGIAGLTAASELVRPRRIGGGLARCVIVVEGNTRIGGRLHTMRRWPEGPLELGAELIHRPRGDQLLGGFSLWNEVDRYHLATRSIAKLQSSHVFFPSWKSAGGLLRAGCGICNDPDVSKALDVLTKVCNLKDGADREAGAMMTDLLTSHAIPRENAEAMSDLLLTGTVPGRLGELSAAGLAFDKVKDQELSSEEFHVSQGFDVIPMFLAGDCDVRLGFKVIRVSWGAAGPSGGVEVEAEDGRVIRARSALCTFSIGVLRAGVHDGTLRFDPPLPQAKLDAIARIECGPISKIVLRFERPFWPAAMSLLGNPQRTRQGPRSYFVPLFGTLSVAGAGAGSAADGRASAAGAGVSTAAPILTALCNGNDARDVDARLAGRPEADSDDALPQSVRAAMDDYVARIVADFRAVFAGLGAGPLPAVTRWCVRSWGNDPWTKGGTSFIRFVAGAAARDAGAVRAALVDHRPTLPLYWAGEATAQGTNPWSVHGAHQSGVDAARNLQAFLNLPVPP